MHLVEGMLRSYDKKGSQIKDATKVQVLSNPVLNHKNPFNIIEAQLPRHIVIT